MKKLILSVSIFATIFCIACSKNNNLSPAIPPLITIDPLILGTWKITEYYHYSAKLDSTVCDSGKVSAGNSTTTIGFTGEGTWQMAGRSGTFSYDTTTHEITLNSFNRVGDAPNKLFYDIKSIPFDSTITPSDGSYYLHYIYWTTNNSLSTTTQCKYKNYKQNRLRKQ